MMKELQIRQLEAQKRMDEGLALMRNAYRTQQRPSPYYLPWQYRNREYPPQPQNQTTWNRVRGCFWDGRNHRKEDYKDLRKAVERGDVHIRDRWIYLGQQGVGDTVLVPIPQEIEGKMKWQKDWVHERLLAKESEIPKVHSIMGDNTTKIVVHNILEQMNGEEVVYKPFWDVKVEEKHARDTWDKGDHPNIKRPAFSPPTKILKHDKPLRHPAAEHEEKHEKRPQPEKMWNTSRDSVDIGKLSRRTLDASVPGVTVRELLSISPDMI